ncbi:MAG TPA: crotonase/enoyl-CoA hydratase family protein [Capillimicrobium sp.]|nr:crotonase/enoyl-CoA hydratase family protein [Capillimicrobium sp.]
MSSLTSYALADGIATIVMDDGKVNALSSAMLRELASALDRAAADEAVVVLTGRERTFSAGFDLRAEDWQTMLIDGATVAERLLAFPQPVVVACNGNAVAMGALLLLCADVRLGADGPFRVGLNEVAIGLTLPWFAIALARHRLARPAFDRCTVTGPLLEPAEAAPAGFLDRLVEPERLADAAREAALELRGVDRAAHAATKLRVREEVLAGVRDGHERLRGEPGGW